MKTMFRLCTAATVLAAVTLSAHADELKIGMVNPERILSESVVAKAATARLKTEFSSRETQILKDGSSLKAAIEKFQKDAPTMAETTRSTREKQLAAQEDDFQAKRQKFQEDLANRRTTELEKIQENSKRIIKQIAESEKYTVILGADSLVYAQPKLDITDQVIKNLDSGK
ncbi:MAG: OmpH family outer membrane protein [Brachymonas sp.]|jgi:outer membrane protein